MESGETLGDTCGETQREREREVHVKGDIEAGGGDQTEESSNVLPHEDATHGCTLLGVFIFLARGREADGHNTC